MQKFKSLIKKIHLPLNKTCLVFVLLFAISFMFFVSNSFAAGDTTEGFFGKVSGLSCIANPITCAITGITYVILEIMGMLIALGAWLVRLALEFNKNVTGVPAAVAGFQVTLSIANMGFVFSIIVIAIATILRRETYGLKQTLWRLVAAALLVNFSMTIAGTIINFSDKLSQSFLTSSKLEDYDGFANALTTVLAPMSIKSPPQVVGLNNTPSLKCISQSQGAPVASGSWLGLGGLLNSTNELNEQIKSVFCDYVAQVKENASAVVDQITNASNDALASVMSMVFAIIFSLLIALTLFMLAIMLLIRYAVIVFLLILMPLAWLTWIFPAFKNNFTKWWNHFIRWTFFPPLVIFFLYLAIATAANTQYWGSQNVAALSGDAGKALALQASNGGLVGGMTSMVILIVLSLGGIFAANSLSITGANWTMGAVKSVGGAVQGYVGKQAKKGARNIYQRSGGERVTQWMQRQRIPGVSIAGRAIATLTERGGKQLVEADSQEARSKDSDRLALELKGFMGNEKRLAFLAELQKRGDLDKVKDISGKTLPEFLKNEKVFKDYGQGKLVKDMDTTLGSNNAMRDAEKEIGELKANGKDFSAATKNLDEATKKFVEGLKKEDVSKMSINEIFGKETDVSKSLVKQLAINAPQLIPNMLSKMKSPTLKNFNVTYKTAIETALDQTVKSTTLKDEEKEEILNRLSFATDAFNKAYANNAFGFSSEEKSGGATTSPPPSPSGAPKT